MGRYSRRRASLEKQDFQRIFRDNKRFIEGCLVVLSSKNCLSGPRLGLAVSRKHLARAVDRNRIKRLVRESFAKHDEMLSSRDIIVISRPGLRNKSNQQVFHMLERLWTKVANS